MKYAKRPMIIQICRGSVLMSGRKKGPKGPVGGWGVDYWDGLAVFWGSGEFFEVGLFGDGAGGGGFLEGLEVAEVGLFAVDGYSCVELVAGLSPGDSLNSGGAVGVGFLVLHVFRFGGVAEVGAPVVPSDAVDVVVFESGLFGKNDMVHRGDLSVVDAASTMDVSAFF